MDGKMRPCSGWDAGSGKQLMPPVAGHEEALFRAGPITPRRLGCAGLAELSVSFSAPSRPLFDCRPPPPIVPVRRGSLTSSDVLLLLLPSGAPRRALGG